MAGGVSGYPTAAASSGGLKQKGETPKGIWYKFYSKSSVYQTSPRSGRWVLQMHPALDLLHHGPVCQGVRVPECHPKVHRGILFGPVQEQGAADAAPHNGKVPARALPVRCGSAHSRPVCLTPARPVTDIFILTGNIGGQGRGRRCSGWRGRTQYLEGRRR